MIFKSYIIEENFTLLSKNFNLFYGENIGLLNSFKKEIKLHTNDKSELINFSQDEIVSNNNAFQNEVLNQSLFSKNKIFIIEQATDKILDYLDNILASDKNNKFFIFANILDKKSKLRNYFEKEKNCGAIACYEDNDLTLKKIAFNKLKRFQPVSQRIINTIVESCSGSRVKLNNELEKIIIFFDNQKIDEYELVKLLNIVENENFNSLKNAALSGDKKLTNKLLSETTIEEDKIILYLSIINQRANQINQIKMNEEISFENALIKMKPPIFWKEKPNLIAQLKKWKEGNINLLLKSLYELEIKIKSNSSLNKKNLIKKFIVDICNLANAS